MQYTKKLAQLVASIQQNNRMLTLTFPNNDVPYAQQLIANHLTANEQLNQDFEFTGLCCIKALKIELC